MKSQIKIKLALFNFILVSIFYVLGIMFKHTIIKIVATALIAPSIGTFYFLSSNRNLTYELILIFSFIGSVLILSNEFLYSIAGIISFWGMILLIADHILKEIKVTLIKQFKKKKIVLSFSIHMIYLIGILFILQEDLGNFIYPIVFYGITLLGASFLSTILWEEEKNKTNLNLMIGVFMLILSGSLLAIKLFSENINPAQDLFRLLFYIGFQYLTCQYFIKHNLKYKD